MLVPKLRFKEFADEWILINLGSLYIFKNGINGDKSIYGEGIKFISVSDILNNDYITYENIKGKINISEKVIHDNLVEYGDILFQRSSETREDIGKSNVYLDEKNATFGGFVIRGKKINNYNPKFINYVLQTDFSRKEIIFRGAGSQHYNIGQDDLKKVKIYISSNNNEQIKIANFLSLLDKKIELQARKIEALKLYKKGLIEKQFKKDYNLTYLSDILLERKSFSGKGLEYPHVTLSKEGIYDKGERYNRDFLVKSEEKKYKITKLNDLCYNPANLKFGVICLNEYGSAIFSPIYVTFEVKKNTNPQYLKYYLTRNNFINEVRKYEQGTVYERMAVSPEDFLKSKIKLPELSIQNAIAHNFNILDKKIFLENQKKLFLDNLKKGLMQNMFV